MTQPKSPKKATRPAHRPTKYKPEYCAHIIARAKLGETFEMIACDMDLHTDTLLEWCSKHPDFSAAYKKAKKLQEQLMQKIGLKGMTGGIKGFHAGAWVFWMKARFKYNDMAFLEPDEEIDGMDFVAKQAE